MKTKAHILNGDCLRDMFPVSLTGDLIVCRECMADGDLISFNTLNELYAHRAQVIERDYAPFTRTDYLRDSVTEFERITSLQKETNVYLWFEQDVHCQVNMWFVCYLLHQSDLTLESIYWICPTNNFTSFAALNENGLLYSLEEKTLLTKSEVGTFSQMWQEWAGKNYAQLNSLSQSLNFDYISSVVEALLLSVPSELQNNRPLRSLLAIMHELQIRKFDEIFEEFSRREWIYGFGDMQVKNILKKSGINYVE